MNKRFLATLSISSLLMFIPNISAHSSAKAGAKCTKAHVKSVVGNKIFTCIKSGKKLVWSKGVLSVLPIENPQPVSSPTNQIDNPQPVSSPTNQKPAIVIIDNAIDTQKINIFYEVCLMQLWNCPNNLPSMEGPGAATLPENQIYQNKFDHGTFMTLIASAYARDTNLIFIRIVSITHTGEQGYYGDDHLIGALKWVTANKTRFNIVAVSASIGNSKSFRTGPAYCPVRDNLRNEIINLKNLDIATIFSAGNNYDKERVDFPACISESIAVGSVNEFGRIEDYSNGGPDLDFYALGTHSTSIGTARGTSGATAAFAAFWAKNYKGSYQATYDYMRSITLSAEGNGIKTNSFVDVLK